MKDKIEVIVVDAGNTAVKSAEFVGGESTNSQTWASVQEVVDHYKELPFAISSVNDKMTTIKQQFKGDQFLVIDHTTSLPINVAYDTPETLGIDRIAVAAGAHFLFPKENNLVIDLGTCVTMDVINKKGTFLGGAIAPGLTMRMKAMADYTSNLPDISTEWTSIKDSRIGKSTKQALLNGSLGGIVHEINGTRDGLKHIFASLNVILTGGDAHFFDSRLKAHIFAGSKIVEIGIYRIWKHQLSG